MFFIYFCTFILFCHKYYDSVQHYNSVSESFLQKINSFMEISPNNADSYNIIHVPFDSYRNRSVA